MDEFNTWLASMTTEQKGSWLLLKRRDEDWIGFWRNIYQQIQDNDTVCDRDDMAYHTES